jgi:hypothetical protein
VGEGALAAVDDLPLFIAAGAAREGEVNASGGGASSEGGGEAAAPSGAAAPPAAGALRAAPRGALPSPVDLLRAFARG